MASMSETDFLRGLAFTLRLSKELQLTSLFSYRKVDATLNGDGQVQTFLRTGYHRTLRERATRRDVNSALVGAHLEWKTASLSSQRETSFQDSATSLLWQESIMDTSCIVGLLQVKLHTAGNKVG